MVLKVNPGLRITRGRQRYRGRIGTTAAASVATMLITAGASSAFFMFYHQPVKLDELDGNYRTLAACAYARLSGQLAGISRTEGPEQGVIRIGQSTGSEPWELAFVDAESGRQTLLTWTAGDYPSEHVLSTVRACAA
jgi:hypothetical protein